MAIARGAGTEIIRSAAFHDINNATNTKLIIGEQHHIYTILSVAIYCISNVSPFWVSGQINGWDADNSATNNIILFKESLIVLPAFNLIMIHFRQRIIIGQHFSILTELSFQAYCYRIQSIRTCVNYWKTAFDFLCQGPCRI